jgi:hypothetical protein
MKITSVHKLFRIQKSAKLRTKFMSQDSGWHINLSVFRRRQSTLPFAQQCFYSDQKSVTEPTHYFRQASPVPRSFIRCRYAKSRAAAGGEGATPDTNSRRSPAITSAVQRESGRLVIAETMKPQALHI